ncbi:RipA family octameric membrane protein [Streptomyces griseorubiginosus]|uniref:RipA family octameric membrane protein n=1 Tax=Streptomyces griseorubiginosus TaxID=67304 RepID=UPI00332C4A98
MSGFWVRYFGAETTPIDVVRPNLWNPSVGPGAYTGDGAAYQDAVLEQYKLYAEMADRVSARRSFTNTFFLTLNTAIFAVIGTFWKDRPTASPWLLLFPLVALIVQCGAWFFLVRSYRQLNSAKYTVIGVLEERLPASPYWSAEWKALGEGKNRAKYWPLTHLEQWVPAAFAATYLAGFIASVAV